MLLQSENTLKLGWEGQHQRSLRTSWAPNSCYLDSDKYANSHVKLSHIPCIKWKTPPKFDLNDNWYVASGEESKEREIQKHRETRVPEAMYLYTAAIPRSPSVSVDVEHWHYDNISIPMIPLKPIEEETPPKQPSEKEGPSRSSIKLDSLKLAQYRASLEPIANEKPAMDQPASDSPAIQIPDFLRKPGSYMDPHASLGCAPTKGKPDVGTRPYLKGDAVAAATAAFTAMIKSKELGNLIDTELLIQLLNHPERIVKSVTEQGISLDAPTSAASKMAKGIPSAPLTGTNVSMVIKRTRDEYGASANTGSDSFPSTEIDTKKRKFMYEPTAPPHIRTMPVSGVKKGIPTLPLPLPGTNMEIRRGNNELGAPATFAPILSSGPKTVTQQSNNQHPSSSHNTGTGTGVASDSRAPSMAFSGSLSDGKMVKHLIDELQEIVHTHGCVEQVQQSGAPFASLPTSSTPVLKKYRTESMLESLPRPNTMLPDLQSGPLSSELPDKPSCSFATGPQVKDSDYYKSLIIQYGDEGKYEGKFQNSQQNSGCLQQSNNMNMSESKFRKPCFFLNSTKGCRNGATCAFQHIVWNDSSPSLSPSQAASEAPSAKRMKHFGLGEECNSNNEGKFQNSSLSSGCLQVNNNMNPFESKFRKLCLFVNSAKGCRNGAACPFQHIVCDGLSPSPSQGASEAPSAKRVKQVGLVGEFGRRT